MLGIIQKTSFLEYCTTLCYHIGLVETCRASAHMFTTTAYSSNPQKVHTWQACPPLKVDPPLLPAKPLQGLSQSRNSF